MFLLTGGILGSAFVLGIVVAATRAPSAWPPTLVMGLLLLAAMAILKTTKLVLTDEAIHFRSLFSVKHIKLMEVVKADFLTGFSGQKPYQRIVVAVRSKSPDIKKDVVINAGLLDPVQVRNWMNALKSRLTYTG
jgi:hypothetical protein